MNKLEKGKQISDLLEKGVNVSEQEMEKLVNSMSTKELLSLLDYTMKKEV